MDFLSAIFLVYALVILAIYRQKIVLREIWYPALASLSLCQLLLIFNFTYKMTFLIFSIGFGATAFLHHIYGPFDFSKTRPTGKYDVAFSEFHSRVGGNAVSVFYPCDEEPEKNSKNSKNWINYEKNDAQIKAAQKAFAWFHKFEAPISRFWFWRGVDINVCYNGRVASDFKSGLKKLVPVVFSHGLEECRGSYTVMAKELASNGYIVFLLDHHDGSCVYTESASGKIVNFDLETELWDYSKMREKVI